MSEEWIGLIQWVFLLSTVFYILKGINLPIGARAVRTEGYQRKKGHHCCLPLFT